MSNENPRNTDDEENSSREDKNGTYKTPPLIVTIEPQTKNKYSYTAKHYRLDHSRYRLEKKAYRVAHYTMVFLIAYTSLTSILAISSIVATFYAVDQVRAFKDSQAARLSIEDFKISEDGTNVSCMIANRGNSIALNIQSGARGGVGENSRFDEISRDMEALDKELSPHPNGFRLASGNSLPNGMHIEKDQPWWWGVEYVSVDIFGREQRAIECWRWVRGGGYTHCPLATKK